MVSTRKKKQENTRLFNQLCERNTNFITGQSNQDKQTDSSDDTLRRGTSSDNASNPAQINYPQVYVHTFAETIVSKVRSEVDNVTISVETRIQDAVLTATEDLVIPGVELATKSANAQSERVVEGNVLEPDRRDFLGNIEGLRMTSSSKTHSHMDVNRIDETRDNITEVLGNEKSIDQLITWCRDKTPQKNS